MIEPYLFGFHWIMRYSEFCGPAGGITRGRFKYCDDHIDRRKQLIDSRFAEKLSKELCHPATLASNNELEGCNVSFSYCLKKDLRKSCIDDA